MRFGLADGAPARQLALAVVDRALTYAGEHAAGLGGRVDEIRAGGRRASAPAGPGRREPRAHIRR